MSIEYRIIVRNYCIIVSVHGSITKQRNNHIMSHVSYSCMNLTKSVHICVSALYKCV